MVVVVVVVTQEVIRIFSDMVFFSFGKRERGKAPLVPTLSPLLLLLLLLKSLTSGENGLVDK
jgi:hypothetical protein